MFFSAILAFAGTAFMGHLLRLINNGREGWLTVRAVTFRCELGHIALTVEPLHLALRLPSPAPSWAVDWAQKFVGGKRCIQSGLLGPHFARGRGSSLSGPPAQAAVGETNVA